MNGLTKEELIQENNELLKRCDEFAANLYRLNNKLKEAESTKGHFISNISNEIMNPFSSIMVLSEAIQKMGDDEMAKAKSMAALIYDEAFHLDFQLKNIFTAAAFEAGTVGIKPVTVQLEELFRNQLLFFEKQINAKGLTVELVFDNQKGKGGESTFVTDEEKLELILKNLLDNAIKFSREKGQIDVHAKLSAGKCIFTVCDNGKGIPKDKMQEVFDRFKQLDDRINSTNTGHGLGLSVVHSCVQLLDGQLGIENGKDKGMVVTVTMPELERNADWEQLDQFLLGPDQKF